jgi:L-lactate dehydrogenase complex protein LldG
MIEPNPNLDQTSVLDDVRRALGRSVTRPSVPPSPLGPFIEPTGQNDVSELIAHFTAEATAVSAQVHVVSDKLKFVGQIVEQIAEICAADKGHEIALSGAEIFAELDLASAIAARGLSTIVPGETDHEQLVARLANCGVGVTAADYAIAETGTIVLSSDEPNALLVSLLPPVHIALLRSSQIAASLDEIISKVGQERIGRPDPSRSVTLVTGPSRTGDVELVLSIGVHGPKELHVIILE